MYIYAYFGLVMHIYCIFLICIMIFVQISCMCGSAYFVHISAYFNMHIMAYLPSCCVMHITPYFRIFTLIIPSKTQNLPRARNARATSASCTSWICRITLSPLRIRCTAWRGSGRSLITSRRSAAFSSSCSGEPAAPCR